MNLNSDKGSCHWIVLNCHDGNQGRLASVVAFLSRYLYLDFKFVYLKEKNYFCVLNLPPFEGVDGAHSSGNS